MTPDPVTALPDAQVCEQARLSRDPRFDGVFFTAVHSTRIYCRPVCPAPWAKRVRYYARFDLLIIDEFGFDRIERTESPQAANLLYKIIDARSRQRSTALVTNIDFDAWGDYLGDPPLAMAFLDRIVDGAIILKINGKSFRAHRARPAKGISANAT